MSGRSQSHRDRSKRCQIISRVKCPSSLRLNQQKKASQPCKIPTHLSRFSGQRRCATLSHSKRLLSKTERGRCSQMNSYGGQILFSRQCRIAKVTNTVELSMCRTSAPPLYLTKLATLRPQTLNQIVLNLSRISSWVPLVRQEVEMY